ncbi:MerR family transcriptional regulator [Sphingopyxis sp. J-6]|uniref:helix-turn-helix domain-containing protein n=1 Tax=Sphingopyxis sp. J-6 TaxID=3122054 RepID=UPI0039841199
MRSKDMADLAGVTPRTLRHYRQIGLLREPPRDRNGYRRYGVADLVRLLRIKGLAAAGIALSDIPSFLEGGGAGAGDVLDTLDRQLADQIARLEEQRRLVARLKSDADLPGAGLSQPFNALTEGRSEAAIEAWREQLTLFAQLLSQEDLARLYAIYERMAESLAFVELGKRFDALGPQSGDDEIAALAKEYAHHFEAVIPEFRDVFRVHRKATLFELINVHALTSVNDSQRKMLAAVASYIA